MEKTAEQYAGDFKKANGDKSKISKLPRAFIYEGGDIGKARKIRSNQELFEIFDRQEEKWMEFCGLVHGAMKTDEFSNRLKIMMPTIWMAWRKNAVVSKSH